MKKLTLLFVLSVFMLGINNNSEAQTCCTPDTTVIDTANPGQISPMILPAATVGQYYEQTVTVLPPPTADSYGLSFDVDKIRIDSVVNLPPGLSWCKDETFFVVTDPNTHYCVNIEGTPTDTGNYQLELYITPWADLAGFSVKQDQVVDDTSISIQVNPDLTSIKQNKVLSINHAYPNPFYDETTISFSANQKAKAELKVYNLLGEIIHREEKTAITGENKFHFDGSSLPAGTYIYSVEMNGKKETAKLMKTE